MKYGTAIIIAAAAVLGCSYVGGTSAAELRTCLPGMNPVADQCQVDEPEPAADPALQNLDREYYCVEVQRMAEKITTLRDQGAGERSVVNVLANENQQQLIWVARQAFWRQSATLTPDQVGLRVWMRCQSGDYPGAK